MFLQAQTAHVYKCTMGSSTCVTQLVRACLDKDLEYLTVWVPEHHSVTAAEYWTRGHSWTGPMGGGETQQDTWALLVSTLLLFTSTVFSQAHLHWTWCKEPTDSLDTWGITPLIPKQILHWSGSENHLKPLPDILSLSIIALSVSCTYKGQQNYFSNTPLTFNPI